MKKHQQTTRGRRTAVAAKKKNRWPLIAIVLAIGLIVGAILLVGPWSGQTVDTPSWLSFTKPSEFTQTQKQTMIQIATDWKAKFGCQQNVAISRMKVIRTSEYIIPEKAERGEISIDPDFHQGILTWTDPFRHSMFHACAGGERKPSREYNLEGISILFFSGGNVVWIRPDGRIGPRKDIEEAAAEYLALSFPGQHPADDNIYNHGTQLLIQTGLSPEEVWNLFRESDVEGFAARFFHKDRSQLTAEDFNELMKQFFVRTQ